jgi:hypothetical protein
MDNLEVAIFARWTSRSRTSSPPTHPPRRSVRGRCSHRNRKVSRNIGGPDLGYFRVGEGSSGKYHVRMEKWYPDAGLGKPLRRCSREIVAARSCGRRFRDSSKDAKDLTPGGGCWQLVGAGSDHDVERYRRENGFSSRIALPEDGLINRVATTLLALAGHHGPGVDLDVHAPK